jgi:hypothetical protein
VIWTRNSVGVDASVKVQERLRERLWGLHCGVVADDVERGAADVLGDLGHGVVRAVPGSGADGEDWHLELVL